MATVEVIEIKPVDPPKEYLIKVSQDEMNFLSTLVGSVWGYDEPGGWKELLSKLYEDLYKHSSIKMGGVDIFDRTPILKTYPTFKRQVTSIG